MTSLVRRIGAIATLSAALFGGLALAAGTAQAATTPVPDTTLEATVIKLTNDARLKNGCAALRTDAKLTLAARAHSADMVKLNYFSHTSKTDGANFVTRAKRAGYTGAIGENIAWGYRTAETVTKGWLDSPGHRANILNCKAKAVGVGLARKADGTPYWTQVFGSI
ncbi:hypothetical protein Val02_48600 [Virgisporangium aliadipatigenens]|uniref:SCP domain-containing protein n=1 Tax=Virgisporangium aliadipatigenens TaxID=741659 RepID=A0A8J3YM24_9ACTN|nr:CAP domain-containing protein [Virgisporangium aliadipatigenens]GIJ47974.1 hypothetical protein Val02_48600 [Virgisporangium aliadipatigenens]